MVINYQYNMIFDIIREGSKTNNNLLNLLIEISAIEQVT